MTSLPASNLRITQRGLLRPGYFADIAVFDPNTIQDHATFQKPRQTATGLSEVFVNGVEVVHNGEHTGASRSEKLGRGGTVSEISETSYCHPAGANPA